MFRRLKRLLARLFSRKRETAVEDLPEAGPRLTRYEVARTRKR